MTAVSSFSGAFFYFSGSGSSFFGKAHQVHLHGKYIPCLKVLQGSFHKKGFSRLFCLIPSNIPTPENGGDAVSCMVSCFTGGGMVCCESDVTLFSVNVIHDIACHTVDLFYDTDLLQRLVVMTCQIAKRVTAV